MYMTKLLFFIMGNVVLIILMLIKTRLWILSKKSGELLLILKPKYGYGKRNAFSNLVFPLVFIILILFDRIGVDGFSGFEKFDLLYIVFLILLTLNQFISSLITIQFREKGILTQIRFIPWKIVNSYEEIKTEYKGKIVDCFIKVNISSGKKLGKFIIHKDLYKYERDIELVLHEKNISKRSV